MFVRLLESSTISVFPASDWSSNQLDNILITQKTSQVCQGLTQKMKR